METVINLILEVNLEHLDLVAVAVVQQHITHQLDQDEVVMVVTV